MHACVCSRYARSSVVVGAAVVVVEIFRSSSSSIVTHRNLLDAFCFSIFTVYLPVTATIAGDNTDTIDTMATDVLQRRRQLTRIEDEMRKLVKSFEDDCESGDDDGDRSVT